MNDVFSCKLPGCGGYKGGPVTAKEEQIARDQTLLEEKQKTLKKLQRKVNEANKAGRSVDKNTQTTIQKLTENIKNIQDRINRETERLAIISR